MEIEHINADALEAAAADAKVGMQAAQDPSDDIGHCYYSHVCVHVSLTLRQCIMHGHACGGWPAPGLHNAVQQRRQGCGQ